MQKMLLIIMSVLFPSFGYAADGVWLLCEDGSIAVNSHEHSSGPDSRETTIKMLIGANSLDGRLANQNAGAVELKGKYKASYVGNVAIDYSALIITLKGKLSVNGNSYDVSSKLNCKELKFSF